MLDCSVDCKQVHKKNTCLSAVDFSKRNSLPE